MKNSRPFLIALATVSCVALLASCKDEEVEPGDLGFDYFPVQVGHWVEYQVDSLWRDDPLDIIDSVSYRLLERVEETSIDAGGRTAYRILRHVRNANDEWVVRDVWTAYRDKRGAELTEENNRRLKLSFPVREARAWDQNVYNTVDELEVAYRDVGEPWSSGGLSFEESVLVRNVVGPNAVERRDIEERYAKGVGLVEKYWEETETQSDGVTGFRMSMVAVAHGN